ncbi:hypothetical protein Q5P01_004866 [Channa striata]|uniref:Vitellogenin domain-containing protein n=1 Tax=Channa striata TaxID=64152 RepID=A0AA88NF27_CHASR|nr:hypothetical protein Q5P01_004866 [Channa striata]
MGDTKLCLLMLLSTSALTFAQDDGQSTCLLAKTYKTLQKYEYRYEAESLNAINGASVLKNGPKASCTVEIEVPQTCSFIVRTTGCSLSEVVGMDAAGNPVFGPAPSSADFAAEMEKYPLKVVAEGVYDVKLYPEDGETTTILNIKRGIISALAVPLLRANNRNMPTIHGKCKTHYRVNTRGGIATDVTLNRDLSTCDGFVPMRDYTSPLALISGMHYPLAQLIKSHQTCSYMFDNKKKHMTSASCTENHILVPFSYNGQYGVTNVGKQELTLVSVSAHNERVFHHSDIVKGLHMEAVEDKSAVQDKNAALNLLRELATLPETEGERRAHLFHKLVTVVRGMKVGTLSPAIPEALAVSRVLTYQVLAQCGTPECSSAIMQILRSFDSSSQMVDASVFAMGLVSNPSALLIHDLLQMAKYKPSKPIMYALSNVVKRFYKAEGKVIPEISSVAEFMAERLGDCSGDNDNTFMTLRVIGNMGPAVVPANAALRDAVIRCVNQPAASLAIQQAAVQVYRLTPASEEEREVLLRVLLDSASPVQKRIAAYLVLMKDPQKSELIQLIDAFSSEQDVQIKSFIISHLNNILTSTESETKELRQKIRTVLQGKAIEPVVDLSSLSRNYKFESAEGNIIFDGTGYLPREIMLEMTLKAFGFDAEMMEIGMELKGFEPTFDALFGENGFFPDTALKTMCFVSDNAPPGANEILETVLPRLGNDRMKSQTSQKLMMEIGNNLKKLVGDLKSLQSPEAIAYLRLLGNELGYLTTKEVQEMAYSVTTMIDSMFRISPSDLIVGMMAKGDNTIFAHYIFMDNEFFLPTLTGVPLRIGLSGTFTPGIKGGIKLNRDMSEVSFMPSAGIEFVTQVGSHIPEYINSGLEMHTNIFHESGLSAKLSMAHDQVKLIIPAPTRPTKLIKMTNTLVAVTGSEVKTITPRLDKVEVSKCSPFFTGMKFCTSLNYFDAFAKETTPYFPLTGDSSFEMELYPTGEVTEYTAAVGYELLKEGEEGRQKVDSLKFVLRAEGPQPTEARAILKYNRKKYVITADVQIPDYDVEAGLRLGLVNGNTRGKGTHSIYLDFLNKNLPQLSLVGRANLKAMKEGMLQFQLVAPSVDADAAVTAKLKYDEEMELELESKIKLMDAISKQKIEVKYDDRKIKVEFKSDMKTEVFEEYANEILDTQVGQTDMRVREIFKTFVEETNNHIEIYADEIPYIENFRLPDMPEISLPEMLFLNIHAKAVYHFSNEHFTFDIPLPYGGQSSEELNFPQTLTTPSISLPKFGLDIVSTEIPMPQFVVPESFSISIPLFGKAEVMSLWRSNLYTMEASAAVGKDALETPSYSFRFDLNGISPLESLSVRMKGLGMLTLSESIEATFESSFAHKFIGASVKIVEEVTSTDKIYFKLSSKIEATSPFGLHFALEHTGVTGINTEEISADNNFLAMVKAGPIFAKTISAQSFTIFLDRLEAKIHSTIQFDSTIFQAQNTISAALANWEFAVVSSTSVLENIMKHVIELSFKDYKLSLKCDARGHVLDMTIHNHAEASAGSREIAMSIETNADNSDKRVHSLLTASLDANGLAVNSNLTVKPFENDASATAREDFAANGAHNLTFTLFGLAFKSKAEATASEYGSYTHDILIYLLPYFLSANVMNNLKVVDGNFINEANLKAELYKIDLTGSLKAMFGHEEVKHIYQVNYADMTATAKYTTTGKVLGAHINHNSEIEIIGLAARISNDVRFNSQSMRFDHSMRCSIVPFDINIDAIFNADGDINMYGKHSAQLYGKFLLKAQPLAFAGSHECRASVTQMLDNGFSLETTFDNKIESVLSLQEQTTSYSMRSKINGHAFNQVMSIYNTAERTGIEISGTVLTNMIDTENQEFTVSGYVKYDKNANTHNIQFPVLENLLFDREVVNEWVALYAEALQSYIINDEVMSTIEDLPRTVMAIIRDMNIEGNAIQLKQYFTNFTERSISAEDVKVYMNNLAQTYEEMMTNVMLFIVFGSYGLQEKLRTYELPRIILEETQQQLYALDVEYKISDTLEYVFNELVTPYLEALIKMIPEEFSSDPNEYILGLLQDSGILDSISEFLANIRELIIKTESDRKILAVLYTAVDLIQKLRIEETISATVQMVQDANMPTKFLQAFQSAIDYLKSTEVNVIFQELNMFIETIVQKLNSFNYNDFVDYTNLYIAEFTAYLNHLIKTSEIPQKLEATVHFPEISFPSIPHFPMEKLVKSLQLPENKLPALPSGIVIPCFGKLYGEMKFLTPIYTVKMAAGFQNTTENEMTPHFTGFLNSQAMSPFFEILDYKLESSTRIAIPKKSRVVLVETVQFNHLALGLEHQASLTLYGQAAQAQAKTAVKVTTTPYAANISNTAFIAIEDGISASLDTNYAHSVDFPFVGVASEVTATQKSIARLDPFTSTLTVDNSGTGKVNGDDVIHKSNLQLSSTPNIATLTFFGDTTSSTLTLKQQITAEIGTLSHFKFNVRNEAEAPLIESSVLVVSGQAKLYDMKVELKANHDTKLREDIRGDLHSGINVVVHPAEFVFELQNRGNVFIGPIGFSTHIELQNDCSVIFTPDSQKITRVALVVLDDYKVFYNVTVLLENSELENLLTDETVDVNAEAAPLVRIIGLVQIPDDDEFVYGVLQQVSEELEAYVKSNDGRLEIDLEYPLPQ